MIHHPGAEYGNNVGCVLLITTKKNLQGLAIVENSGFLFDSFVSNNHDLDLTYTRGKMTYYGKLGYANWQGNWKEQDITTNYVSGNQAGSNTGNNAGSNTGNNAGSNTGNNAGSNTGSNAGSNTGSNTTSYIASSTLDCKHSYNDHFYWSAGADLALTESQTIGVKYDGYNIHQPMPFKMTSYAMTNNHVDDNVTGDNKFLYYDWQHHVNAFYQGKYGEKWKLNFFGDFVKLHTEQAQFVDEISERGVATAASSSPSVSLLAPVPSDSIACPLASSSPQQEARNKFTLLPQSDGTIWGAKARANYTINDKQTWMMGAEYNYVKSESRADYTPTDKGTSTHSITKENHAAVFAEYSLDFKPFSLRVGLRYEHVDSRLNYLKDETGRSGIGRTETGTTGTGTPETASTEPLHRKYDNLYPSLLLTHQSGRFSQSLSYRSSETRPSFQELNTGTVYANRYMRQVGNSQLEPSKRHEFQYQASYGDIFFQASYTYVKDYITSIITPDSDDPQTGYITWTNIDHCWNWGSFLGYRHRWGFYEPQVQAGIQQGFIKAVSMGKEKGFHDPYYIFSLYNGFHLPKGWYMNLSFSYRSSGTYDFVTISSVHNFDFQLYKSFLKDRLSLSLNVSDIFNTRRQKTDGTYGNVRFQQQKWEDTRSVQLRLTYRFNQAKKQYRGENSAQEAVGRMGGK